jgi:hypothetical protein
MKTRILIGLLLIGCSVTLPVAHAQTTLVVKETGHGTQFGTKPTQGYSVFGATPAVQQVNTSSARGVLQLFGFMATGGQDYGTQHTKVSLTAAQINGMYAAPVLLVSAPGAGLSVVPIRVSFRIVRTSTAFAAGGAAIVQYSNTVNGGGTQALDSTIASTVVTGSAGTSVTLRNGAVISDLAAASIQNVGLYLSNATAAFTTGTGTAVVDLWYHVTD